jgi:hypothetical protein
MNFHSTQETEKDVLMEVTTHSVGMGSDGTQFLPSSLYKLFIIAGVLLQLIKGKKTSQRSLLLNQKPSKKQGIDLVTCQNPRKNGWIIQIFDALHLICISDIKSSVTSNCEDFYFFFFNQLLVS